MSKIMLNDLVIQDRGPSCTVYLLSLSCRLKRDKAGRSPSFPFDISSLLAFDWIVWVISRRVPAQAPGFARCACLQSIKAATFPLSVRPAGYLYTVGSRSPGCVRGSGRAAAGTPRFHTARGRYGRCTAYRSQCSTSPLPRSTLLRGRGRWKGC